MRIRSFGVYLKVILVSFMCSPFKYNCSFFFPENLVFFSKIITRFLFFLFSIVRHVFLCFRNYFSFKIWLVCQELTQVDLMWSSIRSWVIIQCLYCVFFFEGELGFPSCTRFVNQAWHFQFELIYSMMGMTYSHSTMKKIMVNHFLTHCN